MDSDPLGGAEKQIVSSEINQFAPPPFTTPMPAPSEAPFAVKLAVAIYAIVFSVITFAITLPISLIVFAAGIGKSNLEDVGDLLYVPAILVCLVLATLAGRFVYISNVRKPSVGREGNLDIHDGEKDST